jgi:glutathione peroxidase
VEDRVILKAAAVVAVLVVLTGAGIWARRTFLAPAVTYSPDPGSPSLYDLETTMLSGQAVDLATYRGKVTLVVNVASQCGYTPQYAGLERLYRELAPRGFSVLAFPSNDFGGQEPGTAEEIVLFCSRTYNVTFPVFQKVRTKAGAGQSPVYALLGGSGSLPQWNFSKYVVGKDGRVRAFFPSRTTPDARELRAAIEQALAVRP